MANRCFLAECAVQHQPWWPFSCLSRKNHLIWKLYWHWNTSLESPVFESLLLASSCDYLYLNVCLFVITPFNVPIFCSGNTFSIKNTDFFECHVPILWRKVFSSFNEIVTLTLKLTNSKFIAIDDNTGLLTLMLSCPIAAVI